MGGIAIAEYGLDFVRVCMEHYWGNCKYPVLFLMGLLWIFLCCRKRASIIFLCYTVFLALTVYNPLLVKVFVPKLGFENEYYRFIWILPVLPGIAYYCVKLSFSMKKTWEKVLCAVTCAVVLLWMGSPIYGVAVNFHMAENIYKVPDDLMTVCEIIHKDSETQNPKVVFDSTLNNMARQYDPSLRLVIYRDAALYRAGSTTVNQMDESSPWYQRQKTILDVIDYEVEIPAEDFTGAIKEAKAEYLVVRRQMSKHEFIYEAGCQVIAKTEDYVVYRCP